MFREILSEPDTRKWLASNAAAKTQATTPAVFREMIHREIVKWRDVAKTAGIRVK